MGEWAIDSYSRMAYFEANQTAKKDENGLRDRLSWRVQGAYKWLKQDKNGSDQVEMGSLQMPSCSF